ncbi:MAG: hypothetical protein N4A36_00660 [Candidatus Gracilibacteria bacterium]|nr:hypothetical protein [Candidatus Gracilibacteria bacterium]
MYCYEKENNRILHTFRKKLGLEAVKRKRLETISSFDKNFTPEVSIEKIRSYLQQCQRSGRTISFYYKDKTSPTTYSNFRIIDENHIQCFSGYGHRRRAYTYRIDRIRKV